MSHPSDPPSDHRRPLRPATRAVTGGRPAREPGAAVNEPVWLTSTYVADGRYDYGRTGNRTWDAFEQTVGDLEGGRALVFSSGMAAIAAALSLVPDGATVVCPRVPYSGTTAWLHDAAAAGRLTLRPVDTTCTADVVAALEGADLLVVESPTNPLIELVDLEAVLGAARGAGAVSVVDSTFATPLVQQPLALGADVVVHSATKYLSGHSDVVLGVAVPAPDERGDRLGDRLRAHRRLQGSIAGPQEVWLALRGLRTLVLRVERAQVTAAELAHRLSGHPALDRVRHPSLPDDPGHDLARRQMSGFGAIVAVDVRGGAAAAERVADGTRVWVHATSLGGVESSLERRRRHAAESTDVPEGLLRLSVGIEDVEDLWDDLDSALRRSQ